MKTTVALKNGEEGEGIGEGKENTMRRQQEEENKKEKKGGWRYQQRG